MSNERRAVATLRLHAAIRKCDLAAVEREIRLGDASAVLSQPAVNAIQLAHAEWVRLDKTAFGGRDARAVLDAVVDYHYSGDRANLTTFRTGNEWVTALEYLILTASWVSVARLLRAPYNLSLLTVYPNRRTTGENGWLYAHGLTPGDVPAMLDYFPIKLDLHSLRWLCSADGHHRSLVRLFTHPTCGRRYAEIAAEHFDALVAACDALKTAEAVDNKFLLAYVCSQLPEDKIPAGAAAVQSHYRYYEFKQRADGIGSGGGGGGGAGSQSLLTQDFPDDDTAAASQEPSIRVPRELCAHAHVSC